ncbi:MAG: hypothetical protein IKB88_00360 [Clostridia bacterium]|nr:hypothetical protein [Clostridia bacterium]
MNKQIRADAKIILRKRKKRISSVIFSLLATLCGYVVIRLFVAGRPYAFAIGLIFGVAYITVKICLNHRLQVQMIMLTRNTDKPEIRPSEYVRSMVLSAALFILKSLELLAFEFVPTVIILLLFAVINMNAISLKFCVIVLCGAVLTALSGMIFYLFSVQKYAKAPFYLAAYPQLTVGDCIRFSINNSDKKAADLLRFKLGFLHWIPLCAAIFPLLYFVPYYKQSLTCKFIRES